MIKKKYLSFLIIPLILAGTFLSSCKSTNTKISIEDEASNEVAVKEETRLGIIKLNAFGPENKKTLTATIEPAWVSYDLEWESSLPEVIVSKKGTNTAEVYATKYLPKSIYSTITVTDTVSGLSATGKVYAWQKPTIINSPIPPVYEAINVNGVYETKKQLPATGNYFGVISVAYTTQYQQATLNVYYKGSFAPVITYPGIHQGGNPQRATASSGGEPTNPGETYSLASYNIYIFKGDPKNGGSLVEYKIISPKIANGPDSSWTTDMHLYSVAIRTIE